MPCVFVTINHLVATEFSWYISDSISNGLWGFFSRSPGSCSMATRKINNLVSPIVYIYNISYITKLFDEASTLVWGGQRKNKLHFQKKSRTTIPVSWTSSRKDRMRAIDEVSMAATNIIHGLQPLVKIHHYQKPQASNFVVDFGMLFSKFVVPLLWRRRRL